MARSLSSYLLAALLLAAAARVALFRYDPTFAVPLQRATGSARQESLPAAYLHDLIDVRYPYNKLEHVQATGENSISAVFRPEQHVLGEVGTGEFAVPMSELSRHLAIAGSLACAMTRSKSPATGMAGPRRYLAVKGTMIANCDSDGCYINSPTDDLLVPVTAVCTKSGKVSATAEISASGAKLTCKYLVADFPPDSELESNAPNGFASTHDHYARVALPRGVKVEKGARASVQLSGLTFPGHFGQQVSTQFYAVASIYSMLQELTHRMLDHQSYDNLEAEFVARRLVPASTPCQLVSEVLPQSDDSEGDGHLRVRLSLIEQAFDDGSTPETAAMEFQQTISLLPEDRLQTGLRTA